MKTCWTDWLSLQYPQTEVCWVGTRNSDHPTKVKSIISYITQICAIHIFTVMIILINCEFIQISWRFSLFQTISSTPLNSFFLPLCKLITLWPDLGMKWLPGQVFVPVSNLIKVFDLPDCCRPRLHYWAPPDYCCCLRSSPSLSGPQPSSSL